ncbi:Neuropeptides capa receptor [Habropoda laboriosa]|uniref:Neuropeptides capa receptor n=1 Tax=Habropoda laboriosa TaxID=597456 RepID=A0A0L7REH5_9HYME|nr:PREDICTED: neuropeptides capa receptor-like [Habropoda laboriosa]KOC69230.1 Neuropeptides capa receptor [Habropoda laboriosa]
MNVSDEYSYYGIIEDLSRYVESIRGPKYYPLTLLIPVTLAYLVIFVTGCVGNIITCIVIWKNPIMHTGTNCYLFNLALSDLLFLVLGLPFELSVFWQPYPWIWGLAICKVRAYFSETSSYVSVLTILAFSIERYMAIYHPLRHYGSGLKRSIWFICVSWLIAFMFAVPFAVYININYVVDPKNSTRYLEESAICTMEFKSMPDFPLCQLSCILFFFIPMVFIAVLYVRIGLRIQSGSLSQNVEGSVHGETRQAQSRKTITRMLSAVVITFFICWAPFHVQRLLSVYEVPIPEDINQEWLFALTGCFYYFSTTINPILYNVMSEKYRNAFKEMCRCSPSNRSISRVGLSSVRGSSTVCVAGPSRGSQVFRARGVNYQRSMKYSAARREEHDSRAAAQLQPDDGDEREKPCDASTDNSMDKNVDEIVVEPFLQELKKSSFLVHAKNGRLRYQVSDKEDTSSNETNI